MFHFDGVLYKTLRHSTKEYKELTVKINIVNGLLTLLTFNKEL